VPVAQPQSTCLIEWCWGGRRKFNARVVREEARDGAKQPDVGAARPQGREGGREERGSEGAISSSSLPSRGAVSPLQLHYDTSVYVDLSDSHISCK